MPLPILILLVFAVCAAAMYTRRISAILALPIMAVAIALLAMPQQPLEALGLVFGDGAARLAKAMTNVAFGAMLAQVVVNTGIAETLIKNAAELAGDRTLPVTLLMTAATAIAFIALSGLGSVIMLGTLVLPVLIGVGLRPRAAACTFLFGMTVGGMWNVANWGFYRDVLKLPLSTISSFATIGGIGIGIAALAYIVVNTRNPRVAWAAPAGTAPPARQKAHGLALITPIIPVALILGFKYAATLTLGHYASRDFDINTALIAASVYGVLTTRPREIVNQLTGAFTEGIVSVAPVIALMIGIGMAVTALSAPPVTAAMQPLLHRVIPTSRLGYVLFFGLLSPLALYRGPLNLYGLGAGIAAILAAILPPALVMGALICTGIVQGVCDPTNTQNVWTANAARTDIDEILKATLPYAMAATIAALAYIALTRF